MYFDCGGKVNHFFRCKNHTFTVFPPPLQIMTKKTSVEKIKLEIVKETKLIAMEMIAAFKDVCQLVFVNSVIKI